MTIFPFKSLAALAALSLATPAAFGQAARSGWTMLYSDQEELQKLMYVAKGQEHGDVYFRCRVGEGWTFLIVDVDPSSREPKSIVISAGEVTERPSFRVEYDDVDEKFYFDAAVPAKSKVLDRMAAGAALTVNGSSYPVATPIERKTIENYVSVCGQGQ